MIKNALVTGGCGFIGSYLVDTLIEKGITVTVVDNLSTGTTTYLQKHIKTHSTAFYQYDIRDLDNLLSIPTNFDFIFHLAAQPDVKISVSNPQIDFEINTVGTFNILELMRKKDIPNLVFAGSSGTIYGEPDLLPTPENYPLKPISNYGAAKAAAEMYCSSFASLYDLNIVCLRLGNIFGPRSTHGVMYDFYHKLNKDPSKLEILGDGKQTKSYLYISDTIEAFTHLSNNINQGYDNYNVSPDEAISVVDIATEIVNVMNLKDVTFTFNVSGGWKGGWKGDVPNTSMNIKKVRQSGWSPKISIKRGIKHYINWLSNS